MSNPKNELSVNWWNGNKSKVVLAIVILLTGVFFYFLNTLYPIYLDDWFYSFNMVNGERIDGFISIIQSQQEHYFAWGGRVILHSIAQFLLWIGKSWADLLNTLAYLAFTISVYLICNKGNRVSVIVFILISIFFWFSLPSFSQNILWKTGSANYLWGGLILFSFVYLYVSHYIDGKSVDNSIKGAGMFFLGLLAGWTNENMALALIFFLIILLILLKLQKKKVPQWMIFGLVGAAIGCVLLLLSPGNLVRRTNDLWVAHKIREIEPSFYFYRFVTVTKLSFYFLLKPFLVYIVLFFIHLWKGKRDNRKDVILLSLLFLSTSAVATFAMSGSPMFPERAWFGIIALLITASMILYANIEFKTLKVKIVNYSLFAVVLFIFIISCKENYNELKRFRKVCEERDKMILSEKERGIQNIVINDYFFQEKRSPLIVLDLQDWLMIDPGWDKRISKYYGVKSIVFREKEY